MAQHINSIIDIWLEQEALPEEERPTLSLDELVYLVKSSGGTGRDVVFTLEAVAAYLATHGALAQVVQLFSKATASHTALKESFVIGRMPVIVDAGASSTTSSRRY